THSHDLVGEWIFSAALFPQQSGAGAASYLDQILRNQPRDATQDCAYLAPASESLIGEIVRARSQVETFLAECLDTIIELRPAVVGFTSVFQQQVASLALAARIKARSPDIFLVFGGANCEGVMGLEMLRQFPFIDAVVSGEGEVAFPALVQRLLSSKPVSDLIGVYGRDRSALHILDEPVRNTPVITDMDALPTPDYDDYFTQWEQSSLRGTVKPILLFETSRGCWWGEKHHCTFCGLNGETMGHRRKSAGRALSELTAMTAAHPGLDVVAVDNILDMAYFKDFIPALAAHGLDTNIFYEVKSNLTKEQLRLLRDARINEVQPGIESLGDTVLRIMRKGVSALQNIQFLKWCQELGIRPNWNLIWGFPGEPAEEYARMAELIPLITHLPPPQYATPIRVDRFSPNFNQSERLGFKNLAPYPAYRFVYPLLPEAVTNLAYYFTYEYKTHQDVESYVRPLAAAVGNWQQCHPSSQLFQIETGERLLVLDRRPAAQAPLFALSGLQQFVYQACDRIRTPRQLLQSWQSGSVEPITPTGIRAELEACVARGIMIREGECYLALAVAPPTAVRGQAKNFAAALEAVDKR
ncbi:MAG: RiPP maturation radical SAM C-methyltransferase, partial [Pyrinomonadaceae bacterium]